MLTTADSTDRITLYPRSLAAMQPAAATGIDAAFLAAPTRSLRAGEPLFSEGDRRTNVYRVESGTILIYKLAGEGSRQIVRFAFAGDVVGLETGNEHTCDAQALSPVRVRSLSVGTLSRQASADPRLAREILDLLSHELEDAHEHLFTIGRLNATGRIAAFLLNIARRNSRNGGDTANIALPGRRSDIADFLCLSVETVSRALTELKVTRTISLRGWRQVRIQDAEALNHLAAGDAQHNGCTRRSLRAA